MIFKVSGCRAIFSMPTPGWGNQLALQWTLAMYQIDYNNNAQCTMITINNKHCRWQWTMVKLRMTMNYDNREWQWTLTTTFNYELKYVLWNFNGQWPGKVKSAMSWSTSNLTLQMIYYHLQWADQPPSYLVGWFTMTISGHTNSHVCST